MKLTTDFDSSEFKCSHCAKDGIDLQFVLKLQQLRDKIGKPIYVTSGYRCAKHPIEMEKHRENPRRTTGTHVLGIASDITCPDIPFNDFIRAIKECTWFSGIGIDKQRHFVHVDTKARQLTWRYLDGRPIYA